PPALASGIPRRFYGARVGARSGGRRGRQASGGRTMTADQTTPLHPGRNGNWWIYRGDGQPRADFTLRELLPAPPPWRTFDGGPVQPSPPVDTAETDRRLGLTRQAVIPADQHEVEMVNAA